MDTVLYAMLKNKIIESTYDDTEIRQKLLKVIEDVNVINGNGEGSISKTIADEIAKVIADAPDNFDTLKELSDWINLHSEDAADMNSRIVQNTNNIANKLDKNQGVNNSGKIAGINESGDIVPMFPMGVEYNEDTNCLEFGADKKLNLNAGIQLDDTLSKKGYAADAASVGELKGDLGELKNVVGITEKQKIEWESGKVSATSDGFVYSGDTNYVRTKEPIKLKAGDSVSISDNTTYLFSLHYIATDGTYGFIGHPDWNPKTAQVDGDYCIVIRSRDASSLVDKVQEVSTLITVEIIQPLSGILGDMEKISNTVNEKQDTLIAGNGIRIAEDGKTISSVGVSDGNSILLSNILNPQSIVAVGGSLTVENGIYTITANGTQSETSLIINQAYEANHRYMLIASVCGDYSEHKPVSMYSRVEEGSINHFPEWVNSKNIPAANVSLDCRNCYHIFEISTSGSYRTSFTVNFGTGDNANGAVFKISNIALIDVTDMDVNYRIFAKAIHAQLNGIVEENSSVELDMTLHYPIQNYNIAFFGDSILGNYSEHEKLAVMSKANVYNFAIGGTTVTNGNALSLCNLIDAKRSGDFTAQDAVIGGNVNRLSMLKNFDFASLDYIVIEIGTNDWRQSYCKIGDDDSTDLKTIKGAYNHVLETIYAINPMVKVFILTPLYRTQFDANTTPNEYSGIYLYQVVDAIKEIANNWGVPVYDMYHNSGVNVANSTVYLLDGTHPTPVMEYRIVDIVYNLITQYIN